MKPEWVYLPAPLDVVRWLEEAATHDDTPEEHRLLLEVAAKTLSVTLDRCCRLASVIEKSEAGL